ncbi:PadR family transcripitonal regulator [Knoellia sinensis KCTC 19936]|uniref:PadR family transcripitonal regulator n=1 Tax=Knoellia sinensis KCTC 19936 TaxID=1385520 RepID=A0A0A0J6S4_9MICO|nr:helix-turn-helix transcriptional regulator [Knoellia sinensis]KGN32474.1 PadR family transcripitonal regulator [Knoellia sinensis KCTC 19936]
MARGTLRMTGPTRAVLETLLAAPDAVHYGLAIGATTALPSGTVHPILARLEGLGWVTSTWEDIDPVDAGRPRRRLYQLTGDGLAQARAAVASAKAKQARLASRAPSAARPQGATS